MTTSHYIELRCGPPLNLARAEIGHVMSGLFHALHQARLALNHGYPIALPELDETPREPTRKPLFVGSVIRVFGSSEELDALLRHKDIRHFIDLGMATAAGPLKVPPGAGAAVFQRVRRDSLSAGAADRKERRTFARMVAGRSAMTPEAMKNRRERDRLRDAQGLRYAYLNVPSLSTKQSRVPIFIARMQAAATETGSVNSHGLSVGGYAVPDF
jgi:CRISPR-associated endoribonuclease Cas6/Csy4 subtype I-F